MDAKSMFDLPISGLRNGIHHFQFDLGEDFFAGYDQSPVEQGKFHAVVTLEKNSDAMVMDCAIEGKMAAICDRCLEPIQLPVTFEQTYFFRYSEEARDEGDVIYLQPKTPVLNIADMLYETTCLGIPMTKVYACEEDPEAKCNEEILNILQASHEEPNEEPGETESNSVWEVLKKLNYDQNN
ncbi:MAG: DUF177 domain-containing protein [Saprospiraceae bacterium]|nr:DUF177 domain-containing protein [Saprospiraceae bacterium]MCB9318200.1 DUF177 domain-containing protein [Lewinellaceae bacterium]